jgi:hypothetical protein
MDDFNVGQIAEPSVQQPASSSEPEQKPVSFNELSTKNQADFLEKHFINREPVQPKQEPAVIPPVASPEAPQQAQIPQVDQIPVQPQTPPTVAQYTPEEIRNTPMERLDPNRLPPELQPYYKSLLADYQRKTMELAEQRKKLEQPQVQQQQAQVDPVAEYEKFHNDVALKAMQMLGITDPEQFVPDAMGIMGSKAHYAAYQKALLEMSQTNIKQELEQQTIKQKNESFLHRETADPEFQSIMSHAEKELMALSGSSMDGLYIAQNIIQANQRLTQMQASEQDLELLQAFWNNTKTKYYSAKQKPVTPPAPAPVRHPVASESTGQSIVQDTKPKRFDPRQAKNMDKNQLANLMGVFATK